ncbi:hypothetical protein BDA96_08G049900 [Sorghum bicolor]|jgi:chromosome segregation ATPase|uniref:Uncharacterized protein n=1 Tax=Sorghum bicolor TaxID=4558 RepID=A0A921U708_SORBI|nr:hypothetical protein BDA96_08G049900 [Sorghum bicolor]
MKTQCESLKSQFKEIPVLRSNIGSLEQEKNALQVEHSTLKTQCQALQTQVEEIPGLRSQVKALGEVGTALRGEKAGLEAELKSERSELKKFQIEARSLTERIGTLEEEEEVHWRDLEKRQKAAITGNLLQLVIRVMIS